MKKRIFAISLSLLLLLLSVAVAFAAPANGYVYDEECVFTETALEQINRVAEKMEETYGVQFVFAMDYSYNDPSELINATYEAIGSPDKAVILGITEEYYNYNKTENLHDVLTEDVLDEMNLAYQNADTYYDGFIAFMQAAEPALSEAVGGDIPTVISKASLLVDDQDILSDTEEEIILSALESASASCGADIAILTTDELNDYGDQVFCDDYYDYNGYGQGSARNGLVFAFDANDPDGALYYISTRGSAMEVITDYVRGEIIDLIRSDLKNGNYESAFLTFTEQCSYYYSEAERGVYYDYSSPAKESFASKAPKYAVISLIIGFIGAMIVVGGMKKKLRNVQKQYDAANYVRSGSMILTENRDTFLYNRVSKTAKAQESSGSRSGGHSSSSGASHGGGGGRL